jgi:lytic murein transglycosylase
MFVRFHLAVAAILIVLVAPSRGQEQPVSAFLAALWPDAQAKGISRTTFDIAMKGFTPDQRVITATRRQPEYGKPVGDYVNAIVSKRRIADAQLKGREWAKTFDVVEKKFQVERWVLLALWGMESDFGSEKDRWDVFRSLATLAYVKFRDPYFRNELIVAMGIMQNNRIAREKMVSSWAGAMGQTQFMPSNFVDYAIDFSGDGRADIWGNVPDVLASTANYLRKWNWNPALPWGFEVLVPAGTTCAAAQVLRNGKRSACAAPTARRSPAPDRASSSFPVAPADRALSSRRTSMCSRNTTTPMLTRSRSATSPTESTEAI